MCGIGILIWLVEGSPLETLEIQWNKRCFVIRRCSQFVVEQYARKLAEKLRRRGPDSLIEHQLELGDLRILFVGSLLAIRGAATTRYASPLIDENGNVLLWNGEIFGGLDVPADACDTEVLVTVLQNSVGGVQLNEDVISKFVDSVSRIQGPYAIVYYHRSSQTLCFGRDPLGRRSLVAHLPVNSEMEPLIIASMPVFPSPSIDNTPPSLSASPKLAIERLTDGAEEQTKNTDDWVELLPAIYSLCLHPLHQNTSSTLMLNTRRWDFVETLRRPSQRIVPPSDRGHNIESSDFAATIDRLYDTLYSAVAVRVATLPPHTTVSIMFSGGIDSVVLAALADRCVPLDDSHPLYLINIAFGMPKPPKVPSATNVSKTKQKREKKLNKEWPQPAPPFDTPDRKAARTAIAALREISPQRRWVLIEVNVDTETLDRFRVHISELMYPRLTLMDFTIASAVWFGVRGIDEFLQSENAAKMSADGVHLPPSRVVLLGMGADEIFGGYSRHRQTYERAVPRDAASHPDSAKIQWEAADAEIRRDIRRIWQKNLGRDDRIVSDLGKEARYPYLDEQVVRLVVGELPLWHVSDYTRPKGVGEKQLLREMARRRLGIPEPIAYKRKAAIHHGSRSAKYANSLLFPGGASPPAADE